MCQTGCAFDDVTFSNPFLAKVITLAIDRHISKAYNELNKILAFGQ
jgi:hypothetical protein